jgi:hypothetical protein
MPWQQINLATVTGKKVVIINLDFRVKLVVAKRDEIIQTLKSQYESALERCSHLEELLEQQRRDFLLK